MDIKECEVGMRVKDKQDTEYTIKEIKNNKLKLKGYTPLYQPAIFEPVNKFEVGDEVINNDFRGLYEKVRYCGENSKHKPIIEYSNGYITTGEYENLLPPKKKDELKKGDKIELIIGYKAEILRRKYDKHEDLIAYFVKILDEKFEGKLDTVYPHDIDKIIYE
ncbi:MAG: hypothetical protein ACLFPS_09090 [Clostridia bacterium]